MKGGRASLPWPLSIPVRGSPLPVRPNCCETLKFCSCCCHLVSAPALGSGRPPFRMLEREEPKRGIAFMRGHSQHGTGIALVTAAAVAWSTAPFFTRLVPFDSWTILFWRGLFGGSFIIAVLLATQGRTVFGDMARMRG